MVNHHYRLHIIDRMTELTKNFYPNWCRLFRKATVLCVALFCALAISESRAEEQASTPPAAALAEEQATPVEIPPAVESATAQVETPAEDASASPEEMAAPPDENPNGAAAITPAANPDEQKISEAALEKYLNQQLTTDFVYQREGRPDPFFPFITQEILQTEADAEQLMGLRKFEPGQLTLVAIIFSGHNALAMVQDSAGMGYTLRKGDKIGRSGEVIDISPNMVRIEETSFSLTKEKTSRTVEMVLKQEGDK